MKAVMRPSAPYLRSNRPGHGRQGLVLSGRGQGRGGAFPSMALGTSTNQERWPLKNTGQKVQ